MQPLDYAKAAGCAVGLLVLNVVIAVFAVGIYSIFVKPGQTQEFYEAAALRIAPWSSHTAGTAIFLAAGYIFAKRKPQRNGLWFAACFTFLYAVIDGATVGFVGVLNAEFGLSMIVKLIAALLGAFAARKTPTISR